MIFNHFGVAFYVFILRGLTLAVIGCLKEAHYGYALLQKMQQNLIDIEANTLYPLLKSLVE